MSQQPRRLKVGAMASGSELTRTLQVARLQLLLQQRKDCSPDGFMQHRMSNLGQAYGWQAMTTDTYLDVIGEALGLSVRLVPLLLAGAADSSSSSSSSTYGGSSSGSSVGDGSRTAAEVATDAQKVLQALLAATVAQRALQALLGYVSSLSSCFVDDLVGDGYTTGSGGLVSWQSPTMPLHFGVWCEYAEQLLAAFEHVVRQQAEGHRLSAAAGGTEAGAAAAVARDVEYANLCIGQYKNILSQLNPLPSYGILLEAAAAAGPGSKAQQQLYGLVRSMVKWAGLMGPLQQGLADEIRSIAVVVTANLLARSYGAVQGSCREGSDCGPVSSKSSGGGGVGISSFAELTQQQKDVLISNAWHMLPWLSLLGCCCLQWAQQLQQLPTGNPKAAAKAAAEAVTACGVVPIRCLSATMQCPDNVLGAWSVWDVLFVSKVGQPLIVLCMEAVGDWLGVCALAPSFVAAGYNLQGLQQQLSGAIAAVQAVITAAGSGRGVKSVAPVVQGLSACGYALSAVAHKRCCNNPGCVALSGPSELQLVKGKGNTCSGCRTAQYCSSECIKQHWKQHRPVCKALAAAAATPVAEAGS